jgi:hypothetical protein
MNKVNELLVSLNSWNKFGSVEVSDHDDIRENFDESDIVLVDSDIVIHYDWMDDDMSSDEKNRFQGWLWNGFFNRLESEMNKLGYVNMNVDMDGSGNGLYYGLEVYRKI